MDVNPDPISGANGRPPATVATLPRASQDCERLLDGRVP